MKPLLIATDLDGSLLDEVTYGHEAALPALATLSTFAQRGLLLVLASSKTRAEVVHLARSLGILPIPLIVENGGALLVPRGVLAGRVPGSRRRGGYDLVVLGLPRRKLIAVLSEIVAEAGARIRAFSSLAPRDIEQITGLSRPAALRARQREWDEPFLAEPADAERVSRAARRRGLTVVRGGRFHHLTGPNNKGAALGLLIDLLAAEGKRYRTVGVGDSGNDLAMLERVDRPIVIPRPSGAIDDVLAARLPRAERAPAPGPAGWNAAVLAVLGGRRLVPAAAPREQPQEC
jgi:mannosyl-3-phosphoglycerate phosphatase